MRKKRLLLPLVAIAAAFSAGKGAAQSNVYSLNVVGYYNITISNGFRFVANQLLQTNLNANYVLPSMPDGSLLYRFDPAQQKYTDASIYYTNMGWYPLSGDTNDPALNLPLGEGFILWSPQPCLATFVGEVLQGTLLNPIPGNWSLKDSMVPQAGLVQTDLAFPARLGDQVVQLADQNLNSATFEGSQGWVPAEPQASVGESFFVWRDPLYVSPTNDWTRTFVVQRPGGPLPVITAFSVRNGTATLNVSAGPGLSYSVQFSTDRATWQTVAASQSGPVWQEPFRGGTRGYYRLTINP